jgi:hypothetical protein
MKKFLIAGSSLAAVAAAGSAGAVDVTLGGSIDMGVEYGVGKEMSVNHFTIGDNYQSIAISVSAAGTTDAGLKFGGSFGLSTATELVFTPYHRGTAGNTTSATSSRGVNDLKYAYNLVNADASANIRGNAFNVSGGDQVTAGQIVSVKINSAWAAAESSVSGVSGVLSARPASTSAICKVAGAIAGGVAGSVARFDAAGAVVNSVALATAVIPAGKATAAAAGTLTAFSAGTAAAAGVAMKVVAGGKVIVDRTTAGVVSITPGIANLAMGPFMEVKMTSSTTKMVIGGVCVTNDFTNSETKIHMDVASRVLHVSDASIYIEGGFGRLAVGTSAYSGAVSGVGGAGDQVEIDGSLNATLSSVSFFGFSGTGAVALDTVNLNRRPNYAFGTSTNLLGLTVAVEMEDVALTAAEKAAGNVDNNWIDLWDAGTSYDLNGMSVAIATDSTSAWAMSLGYELLGFSASSTIENIPGGSSDKSGLNIDTTLATSLNGVAVSVGLDEDLAWSIGAAYSIGGSGLDIYVNYSQAEEGGTIGATMSF